MTADEIVRKVKTLNLPYGSFIVFGSGPLAALSIRETSDIDMLVTGEVREKLKKIGWEELDKGANDKPLAYKDFEVHDNWNFSTYSPTLKELQERKFEVAGIPFASLEDVRKWKVASGRPKDLADLKLIEEYYRVHK